MSKFFIEDGEVERLTFGDGEWVDLKLEFTQLDRDYMLQQMASAETVDVEKGGQTVKDVRVSLTMGRIALLERGIVAWSFKNDAGKPVPVNRDSVSRLRGCYREPTLEKIDALSKEAEAYVRKNS
ncbi:MAG: hypothetical protein WC683_13600 [bacterium]